jgi:predicted N-acetyltransferase YhbS
MDLSTKYRLDPLSVTNIHEVYQLYQRNVQFISMKEKEFIQGTLQDKGIISELSLVVVEKSSSNEQGPIVANIICVRRKGMICGQNLFIKGMIVDASIQRQGIGSWLLSNVLNKAKTQFPWKAFVRFGDSAPGFWTPGVDLRHTSMIFFLKKHGFKVQGLRQNLIYSLASFSGTPKTEKNGYHFERLQQSDFDALYQFVSSHFRLGVWPEETTLSYINTPPTSFVAKDANGTIVGWASHSIDFPGTFGPTGVLKSLRGKGVGGELLKWCMWDLKEQKVEDCIIRWVVGDTVKFYSKTLGAYIGQVFHPMAKRM